MRRAEALRAHPGSEDLVIETDSQYAINCSTKWVQGWKRNGWKNSQKKPVKNADLIRAIDNEIAHRAGRCDSCGSRVMPATRATRKWTSWHARMRAIAVRMCAKAICR